MSKSAFTFRGTIHSWGGLVNLKIDSEGYHIVGFLGDGGEGKSSCKSAIEAMLTGIIPPEAINTSTKQAKAEWFFTKDGKEYQVKLSKSPKSEVVKFIAPDGPGGGKEALQKIVGDISFDPFKLKSMKPKDQVSALKDVFNIDTKKLDETTTSFRKQRTAANANKKAIEGYLLTDPNHSLDLEAKAFRLKEEKPVEHLLKYREDAILKNKDIAVKAMTLLSLETKMQSTDADILETLNQIKQLEARLTSLRNVSRGTSNQIQDIKTWLNSHEETPIKDLNDQIRAVEEHNKERADFVTYLERHKEYLKAEKYAQRLDGIVKHREWKRAIHVKSKLGVIPNMTVYEKQYDEDGNCIQDQEGVFYLGRPLSVLSDTEIIKFTMMVRKVVNKGAMPILILDQFADVGTFGREQLVKLCRDEGFYAILCELKLNMPLQIVLSNNLDFENPKTDKKVYPVEKRQRF